MWIKRGIALALCAVVIGLCCVQVLKVDTGMQYLILSPTEPAQDPEKPTPTELSKLIDKLKAAAADWSGIISCWALSSQNETVSLSGKNAQNTSARLVGVYGNQAALPGQLARFGRTFYEEELAHGDKVILLSEALAIALFRAGDPVDRIVTIGETEYRVIGILRGGRTPGDHDEYTAWVPLLALDQAQFQTTTLTVSARSLPGAGAASQFKTDMNVWHAGGDLYLLSKERQRALLPARLLAAVMGFAVMLRLMTLYRRWAASLYRDYRRRLESQFAVQLLPRLLGYGAMLLAAFGVWLAAMYFLVQFMLQPVYVFPEWVPAVPVEISEILKTFWQNQASATRIVELRTPELLTLRFYRSALTAVSVLAGLIFFPGWRASCQKADAAHAGARRTQ